MLTVVLDWEEDRQDKEEPTLWEDDWDDEDVEDDFSAQLRYTNSQCLTYTSFRREIEKQSRATPMETQ